MSTTGSDDDTVTALAEDISRIAQDHGFTLAVAESLTGGRLSCHLAAASDSASWYAGGVTSYMTRIKYAVLGVPEGDPVITEDAASQMVSGVSELMNADAAVAVTGAGGPGRQEDNPPGTTWIAALVRGQLNTELHHFPGEPEDVLAQTEHHALALLHSSMVESINHQEKNA